MAELDEMQWDLAGLLMGDGTPYDVQSPVDGLESAATHEHNATDRGGDGVSVNRVRMRDRLVEFTIVMTSASLSTEDLEELEGWKDALRAAVSRMADGVTPRLLRWRHSGPTKRVEFRPASGNPLEMGGTIEHLVYGQATAVVRLHVSDPYIYSDELHTQAFSASSGAPATHTIVNAGTLATTAQGSATLGTWNLSVVAGGSGASNVYLKHADYPGETWLLAETFPASGTASVGYDRVTLRGGVRRSGGVKGANGSPVAGWPVLRPGDNDLEMGCASGSFSATFRWRDTWGT